MLSEKSTFGDVQLTEVRHDFFDFVHGHRLVLRQNETEKFVGRNLLPKTLLTEGHHGIIQAKNVMFGETAESNGLGVSPCWKTPKCAMLLHVVAICSLRGPWAWVFTQLLAENTAGSWSNSILKRVISGYHINHKRYIDGFKWFQNFQEIQIDPTDSSLLGLGVVSSSPPEFICEVDDLLELLIG